MDGALPEYGREEASSSVDQNGRFNTFQGRFPESQSRNLVLGVLYVPCSLENRTPGFETYHVEICIFGEDGLHGSLAARPAFGCRFRVLGVGFQVSGFVFVFRVFRVSGFGSRV